MCVCVFVFSFVVFCWFIDFKGGFGHTWGNIYIYVYLHGERERECVVSSYFPGRCLRLAITMGDPEGDDT